MALKQLEELAGDGSLQAPANLVGSEGDFFSIKLSSATVLDDELDPATVFYARAGYLAGRNLTVK